MQQLVGHCPRNNLEQRNVHAVSAWRVRFSQRGDRGACQSIQRVHASSYNQHVVPHACVDTSRLARCGTCIVGTRHRRIQWHAPPWAPTLVLHTVASVCGVPLAVVANKRALMLSRFSVKRIFGAPSSELLPRRIGLAVERWPLVVLA